MSGPNKIGGGGGGHSHSLGFDRGGSGKFKAKGGSGEKSRPPGWDKGNKGGSGEWMPPGLAKKSGKGGDGWDRGSGEHDSQGGSGEHQSTQGTSNQGLLSGLFSWMNGPTSQGVTSTRTDPWTDPNSLHLNGPGTYSDAYADPAARPPVDLGTGATSAALPARADAGAVPRVDQYNPVGKDAAYTNGIANCGPAVMAMLAKATGQDGGLTDAQLINKLGAIGGTTAKGTTGNGMIAIAESLGLNTAAREGADLNWINQQLAAGHRVTVNGDYYSVPDRYDPQLASGHYLMVTGYQDGMYNVVDPASAAVTQMTANQMQAYIVNQPEGGFSVSMW